ncbi:MAG: GNAT family N-acetyltransferase [Ruminococcus sp.]|nr:GNAT family N-acetyltransferase [Ruminococcus sp.]MDE6848913.1 GNAT family N-acetyltransferase [Ruminococcus sp.]
MSDYTIRKIKVDEYKLLDDFLYEAIFIPDGVEPPPKSIIEQPELQVYVEEFGKKDDYCLIAEKEGRIIGAVWVRIMDDYGHIADNIPSLAISLYKEFRGHGIGTDLLDSIILLLKSENYEKVSLSVQKENYAYRMYLKAGFDVVDENDEE